MSRKSLNRREFLKKLGIGTGSAMALMALEPLNSLAQNNNKDNSGTALARRYRYWDLA